MWQNWLARNLKGDPIIWFVVLALSGLSVLVVYSATGTLAYKRMGGDTEYYLFRHGLLVVLCLVGMWFAHKVDYRLYGGIAKLALLASVPLLGLAFFFGTQINEASRWLTIPVINQSFQPSDLAKLALITHMASMLARRQEHIQRQDVLLPLIFWSALICSLIALSNLSTAILLFLTCLLLMFIGRVPFGYLLGLALIVVLIGGGAAVIFGQRGETALARIENFREGEVGFQREQSYIAIATGGLLGKGPGQSDQRNFLPHPYSDFIFAILIEEYGLVGAGITLLLYMTLLYRGMSIAADSTNAFGGLLAAGLSFSLTIQALINMAVAVGLVPVTGQPLPLLSMGGTSLVFTGFSLGIILSVSRGEILKQTAKSKQNNERTRAA